jgi:hypothetical protein
MADSELTLPPSAMPLYIGAYGLASSPSSDRQWASPTDENGAFDGSISSNLRGELRQWHAEFRSALIDPESRCAILDWKRFHEKGLALARCLKLEIGSDRQVIYVKPLEDPNLYLQTNSEVFEHGEVVQAHCRLPDHLANASWLPRQIVSGGQTGADRAALDFACFNKIPHGGWCPQGRMAVDGPLSFKYQLRETDSSGYRQRTKRNIQDSDATVIFNTGAFDGGTLQTQVLAEKMHKPHLLLQLDEQNLDLTVVDLVHWLDQGKFSVLNVAGPREEKRPGIYRQVRRVLDACLNGCGTRPPVSTLVASNYP